MENSINLDKETFPQNGQKSEYGTLEQTHQQRNTPEKKMWWIHHPDISVLL